MPFFSASTSPCKINIDHDNQWLYISQSKYPFSFHRITIRGAGSGFFLGSDCSSNGIISVLNGENTYIAIAEDCMMSHAIEIYASDEHAIFSIDDYNVINPPASVCIKPHVWIGAKATILKGVTIDVGCVVGAGSIVASSVPAFSLVAGVPARVIRVQTHNQ